MAGKSMLFFKWTFVFSVLTIFSFFIMPSSVAESYEKDFNIPIYIQTSAGIERASLDDIIGVLFNYDFEIQDRQEYAPDESCSLRAENGALYIEDILIDDDFGYHLNFYIPLKNDGPGQGSLTAQKDRKRFSLSFEVQKILETNSEKLVFRASGEGNLNREKLNFDNVIVTFNKLNSKVEISGSNYKNFNIKDMEISFLKGCFGEEKRFYLIIKKSRLGTARSLEEVREILDEHPEFIDMYGRLVEIYKPLTIIPEFGTIVAVITLVSAIGVFFIIKKSL